MLGAEISDFQGHAVASFRRGKSAGAGVVERRDKIADHFYTVWKIEHDNATGRFDRADFSLWRLEQLRALHDFVDVGRLNRNNRGLKERIDLAQLLDRAHDQAFADGPVVVTVRKQNRVEDLAEGRLLEGAVNSSLNFAGDDVDIPLLADHEQGFVERDSVQVQFARMFEGRCEIFGRLRGFSLARLWWMRSRSWRRFRRGQCRRLRLVRRRGC